MFSRLGKRISALFAIDYGIDFNMHGDFLNELTSDLYLGARPSQQHIATLKELGITHIVSCLHGQERPKMAFLEPHFDTLFLPVHDGINEDIASYFPSLFEFAAEAQARQPAAKLYVHCQAGVSRSSTLAIALLMQRTHQRFFETFRQVKSKRIQVLPNIGFASQLQQFERTLYPHAASNDGPSSLARYLHESCNVPTDIELLQKMLEAHNDDAAAAIRAIFGNEIPRVVQGVRL